MTVNGKKVTDFKDVTEKEIDFYKQVNLMKKTGHMKLTPRYGVSVIYIVPSKEKSFAWENVVDGTLIIIDEGGKRTTYSGVYILKAGEQKRDGDNELTQTIDFGAEKRISE